MKRCCLVLFLFCLVLISCGKYSKPLPPEDFAPSEVKELAIGVSAAGVSFGWQAPKTNSRGKELKDLEGYRICRRELAADARLVDPYAKFELIGTVEDTHLKELLEMREKASEEGQISRRITLPEERSNFSYLDNTVVPGKNYYYQIVPVNQGGIEGQVAERINVVFRGEISQVVRIPYSAEAFEF